MSVTLQKVLLGVGVVALLFLVAEIALSVAATMPSSTPAKVVHVHAGPYPLTVNLYKDPANAGFALSFSIVAQAGTRGPLHFDVSSIPGSGVDATPIHSSIAPDANASNSVQGAAEITVQGPWSLHITVTGPAGQGVVDVPIIAVAPPAIPQWTGWLIGCIPLYGLLALLLTQHGKKKISEATAA
jgi:hypothetical protein